MKILYINTAEDKAKIGLVGDDKVKFLEFGPKQKFSEKLLTKIDQLLKEQKTKPEDLDAVAVFRGPGSFTGLRIGIAAANAFGFTLNIPIIEISENDAKNLEQSIIKKFQNLPRDKFEGKIVVPFYGKKPNITKSKKIQ